MSTKALDLSQTSNFFSANTNNLEVEADVSFLNNIVIGGAVNGRPASADYVDQTSATGSAELPAGTTGERDGTPSAGYLRFNTSDGAFEGYDGSEWGALGGGDPIGVGQSWQGVSLSSGTARQNTTGRPIQVAITVRPFQTGTTNNQIANSSNIQVSSNGSSWITVASTISETTDEDRVTATVIIPSNHYYRYNGLANHVAELR